MEMENRKPFNPKDIDETLTRVVAHGGDIYLMFPYINAVGISPKFNSISHVIRGPTATKEDLLALSSLVMQAGEQAEWFISFNTPWLIRHAEAENIRQRASLPKPKRK
jgi:hypothetical protein